MEEAPKKRSPWLYVGLGCLGTVVLGCLGTLIVTKLACSSMQQWGEDLKDQSKQEVKARRAAEDTLGGSPAGYFPVFAFGIPFVIDMIVFLDQPPSADGGLTLFDRSFNFMRIMETEKSKEMRDYFEKGGDISALKNDNFQVQAKEELARGNLTVKDRKVYWVAVRGKMQMQGPYETPQDGIVTTMLFDCPKDGKMRIGIWQMKDEGGSDLKGTVADPDQIEKMLNPLSPCGK
jgi:hypothetical protein